MVTRGDVVEVKSLARPPQEVCDVMKSVCLLLGRSDSPDWDAIKKMMARSDFLVDLQGRKASDVKPASARKAAALLEPLTKERVKANSAAVLSLYKWCVTTMKGISAEAMIEAGEKPVKKEVQRPDEGLKKADLTELKSLSKPPHAVNEVLWAVCMLLGVDDDPTWNTAQKAMANPNLFLESLGARKASDVDPELADKAEALIQKHTASSLQSCSRAVISLYRWCESLIERVRNPGTEDDDPAEDPPVEPDAVAPPEPVKRKVKRKAKKKAKETVEISDPGISFQSRLKRGVSVAQWDIRNL